MDKNNSNKRIRLRVGEIEFKAEGDVEFIEREREEFISTLLPLAVETVRLIKDTISPSELDDIVRKEVTQEVMPSQNSSQPAPSANLLNMSMVEFVTKKGAISHNDFIMCAAYYDEKANSASGFSIESVKKYYEDARKKASTNPSQYLNILASKGLIIDSPEHKGVLPKIYLLSNSGLVYVEAMKPKEGKEKKVSTKPRRSHQRTDSQYADISLDELNLSGYPDIKLMKTFKEKMMLVLYIIKNEKKGEWFSVNDVVFLMKNRFGEAATTKQVKGVFERNVKWFDSEKIEGSREIRRKLLNTGVAYAESISQPVD